jgi:hypothetical protein
MLARVVKGQFIKNNTAPICKQCVFCIPNKVTEYIRCMKYGSKDLVTGEINYEYAAYSRASPTMCSQAGNSFQPRDPPSKPGK